MFLFQTRIENASRLEKTLLGHRPTVNWLERQSKQFAREGVPFYALLVGARGSGKTHLLSVLRNRISKYNRLSKKIVLVFLGEEELGIDSYFDFLIRIFHTLHRSASNGEKLELKKIIQSLQETAENYRIPYAERFLLEYLRGRSMLLLLENLEEVFRGLRSEGQSKWRDYLQKYGNTAVVATARRSFEDIRTTDRPFFNFFNITHLEHWPSKRVNSLMTTLAEIDHEPGLVSFLKNQQGMALLKSAFSIVGGYPRHWLAFFESLKSNLKKELCGVFLQTVDLLNPYHEGFLKLLAPQQQKIIQYLALQRNPQTGKNISRNCFLNTTTVSKQLSELQRRAYINSYKEGRESFYELKDPMLRITLELNDGQEEIVKQFIIFLENLHLATEQGILGSKLKLDFSKLEGNLSELEEYMDDWSGWSKSIIRYEKEVAQQIELVLGLILKYGSETMLKKSFKSGILKPACQLAGKELPQVLGLSIILLLQQHKKDERVDLKKIWNILRDIFEEELEFHYPLKFLEIAHKLFRSKDHKAWYELALEERKAFEQFVCSGDRS